MPHVFSKTLGTFQGLVISKNSRVLQFPKNLWPGVSPPAKLEQRYNAHLLVYLLLRLCAHAQRGAQSPDVALHQSHSMKYLHIQNILGNIAFMAATTKI